MMGVLGCETHTAYLYARRGQHRITQITDITQVAWGRKLNGSSQAVVTIGTASDPECCYMLGQIEPWSAEVVIFRGSKRVWEGPITEIEHGRQQVILYASDVFTWTGEIAHRGRITGGPVNAMEEWELMFNQANAQDQGVLEYFTQVGTAPNTVDRDIKKWSMYYDQDLVALARNGFQFTTVGRRVIQFSDDVVLGRLPDLSTGEHILSDVKVRIRGRDFATDVIGINKLGQEVEIGNGDGFEALVAYGKHEHIVDVDDDVSLTTLGQYANEEMFRRYPMPYSVEIPNGAQLSPDTPWDINEMVPGAHLNVKVSEELCVKFARPFMLTSVDVVEQAGVEQVKVNVDQLSPIYNVPVPPAPPSLIGQRRQGRADNERPDFRGRLRSYNDRIKRLESKVRP